MKKYEFIGILLSALIILSTYSVNYFYEYISNISNQKIIKPEIKINNTKNNSFASNQIEPLIVTTSKDEYYRFELVDIIARYIDLTENPITNCVLIASVHKNNKIIESVGGIKEIELKYDNKKNLWFGRWPIPYNPELGNYTALVKVMPNYPGPVITASCDFKIIGKEPTKPKKSLCPLLIEYGGDIVHKPIIGPDNKIGNWHNIIEWAKFINADAIFMLAGESETYNSLVTPQNPFDPILLKNMEIISKETKKHNLKFGAWIMNYGYQGKNCEKLGYEPSLSFNTSTGNVYPSYMHISLSDKKRFNDVLNLIKKFDENPNIDFIGLDYNRTGHSDGYELAEECVKDMSISVPENWEQMSKNEKAIWFARKIVIEKDENIIERFRWWRAHKIATIVNDLINLSGTKKPVWVFTLGWEHGKQHGQDPLMFTDTGIAYDFVMLYEANNVQFRQVLVDWKGYVSSKQVNIVAGQTIDVTLLDSPNLLPPEEFVRRITLGSKKLTFGGMCDGIFIHDLSRALWGKKGEFTPLEWFITAGKSISDFRNSFGELEIKVNLSEPEKIYYDAINDITFTIENQSLNEIKNIETEILETPGIFPLEKKILTDVLVAGEKKSLNFKFKLSNGIRKNKYMIAVRSKWNNQSAFDFKYVKAYKYITKRNKTTETQSEESQF